MMLQRLRRIDQYTYRLEPLHLALFGHAASDSVAPPDSARAWVIHFPRSL